MGPNRTVVSFHGGPEGQERPAFSPLAQSLVAAGLTVFAPDVRGSGGHGRAFQSADDGPAKFRRHLAGPAADVNPQPLSIVDVLVSAAPADQAVAAEIEAALQAAGLSTERAAWPTKRDLGDDDGRRRFLGCQILVTVLSEHSVGDPRPSIEAGAAWALG